MSVWLLTDAATDRHRSPGHAERPDRRTAVVAGVRAAAGPGIVEPEVEAATDDLLTMVHDPGYLAALDDAEGLGGGWLDPDTYLVPGSLRAARLAAGATAQAALAAATGEAEIAFAVMRPPGHHADREQGRGFCLFNNVAVAVAALRTRGVAQRIAIIDWDVHHGDGTQSIFEADPDLCYASTHQAAFYPGTGWPEETGIGDAVGTMHNRPLAAGTADAGFVQAWRELLVEVELFGPEAILVSAGYDAHVADPLAGLAVTETGFEVVGEMVGALGARLDRPGIALTLEGGYDLEALTASAVATVRGLVAGRARTLERA
ncbi:MAG: histone deacetylase [Chloroflexi bacterium]|nr:histone deacetylase [Chloroflexota bacterium]